jgi:hypothetical protein
LRSVVKTSISYLDGCRTRSRKLFPKPEPGRLSEKNCDVGDPGSGGCL